MAARYVRKKLVEFDGISIVIGSLSVDEVEEKIANAPVHDSETPEGRQAVEHAVYDLVCTSLMNAQPNEVWAFRKSPEETLPEGANILTAEFDSAAIYRLQTEIYRLCGLALVSEGEVSAAAPAAAA